MILAAVAGLLSLAPAPSLAQDGEAAQTVVCESKDNRRRLCAVALDGRTIEIARRISRDECMRGVGWDYDARGVWVDRGCRAEFRVVEPPK